MTLATRLLVSKVLGSRLPVALCLVRRWRRGRYAECMAARQQARFWLGSLKLKDSGQNHPAAGTRLILQLAQPSTIVGWAPVLHLLRTGMVGVLFDSLTLEMVLALDETPAVEQPRHPKSSVVFRNRPLAAPRAAVW